MYISISMKRHIQPLNWSFNRFVNWILTRKSQVRISVMTLTGGFKQAVVSKLPVCNVGITMLTYLVGLLYNDIEIIYEKLTESESAL